MKTWILALLVTLTATVAQAQAIRPTQITFGGTAQPVTGSGNFTVAQGTAANLNATIVGTGTFAVQAAQSGTWNITNVSGTVSLPTGASTAAKQPALGTAGSPSADVISIQGVGSGTAVPVSGTFWQTTQPVSGTFWQATQPVSGTFWQATQPISGTVTANQGGSPWQVQSNSANIATQTTLAALLAVFTNDPCASNITTRAVINISTATTTQLIAASASNKNYICDLDIVVGAADNVALIEDDTAACASPTAGMAGGVTAASGWNFAANGGLTKGNGKGTVYQTAATNRYTCLITSAAAQVSGSLSYVQVP